MATEIERKFLVRNNAWKEFAQGISCRQGYLAADKERTVRVRVAGSKGFLTIKGLTSGTARAEFEYEIPVGEAEIILSTLCRKPLIEKIRYCVEYAGLVWEIDEFIGENAGLIIAEVELESEDQKVDLPDWAGAEVSDDPRYFNANLIDNPFKNWQPSR